MCGKRICLSRFMLLPPPPQKRRSNRQVKRKKYTEDLDIKITDDEDDEELDVTGPIKTEHLPAPEPPAPEPIPEGETLPSMQFFVVRRCRASLPKLASPGRPNQSKQP